MPNQSECLRRPGRSRIAAIPVFAIRRHRPWKHGTRRAIDRKGIPMANRMSLDNRTAVITGAASGIGRALAVSLAARRCNLALVDINAAGLAETARMLQSNSLR